MAVTGIAERAPRRTTSPLDLLYRPEVRQVLFQIILVVALAALFWMIISNTAANLKRQNIASGFGFWNTTAGFDISQTLIDYTNTSTYGRAFWVGLTNTILVAVIGVFFATIVGFTMGIARLSTQLADRAPGHRLRRDHPQHAAAAAAVRVVFRGPEDAAAAAPEPGAARRRLPQSAGALSAGADPQDRLRLRAPGLGVRHPGRDRRRHLGPPPPTAHGSPVPRPA